jgi:ABC-2 type transport system permease protein
VIARESLTRIIVIAEKEWTQIQRDLRSLILSLFVPSLLVLLFGYALNVDVKNISIGIYDQDKGAFARSYIEKFSHTEYLKIKENIERYDAIDYLIDSGQIIMAVVIPRDFEKRFKSGKSADVQLLVDGSDSTSAMIATGYVKAITLEFNNDINLMKLKKKGIIELKQPVEVRNRIWYNPELESKNFIIPGLIVLILSIISALITSLTISREWERGTMETLITTPVRGSEVVLGKLIPYLFIGIFDVVLGLCIGYFAFNVPFKGNFIELCLISFLFLAGTSSLGILISAATRVQVLSVQVAIVSTYLPSFILSNFIFPIRSMPFVIQAVTYIVPAKYLITVIKGIALKGTGYALLWLQILFLSLFCIIVVALSIRKFKVTLPG